MTVLCALINVYLIIVLIRVVLSWFPIPYGSPMEGVASVLYAVTEPVLGPVRRALPPVRLGALALDLSPIVVFIGLQILRSFVC